MKLIVTGATGFVGSEVIRQSLRIAEITSVIAVARKPVPIPDKLEDGADASKLKSVVVDDYGVYSPEVRKEFADANACIWTVAITPSKSDAHEWDKVKYVCQECTLRGFAAMYEAGPARPFRFLYVSGVAAERDQTKTPMFRPRYSLMRGETENKVAEFAAAHKGELEATAVKPGFITAPGKALSSTITSAVSSVTGLPKISNAQLSLVMMHLVKNGFEKDPYLNSDLLDVAKQAGL